MPESFPTLTITHHQQKPIADRARARLVKAIRPGLIPQAAAIRDAQWWITHADDAEHINTHVAAWPWVLPPAATWKQPELDQFRDRLSLPVLQAPGTWTEFMTATLPAAAEAVRMQLLSQLIYGFQEPEYDDGTLTLQSLRPAQIITDAQWWLERSLVPVAKLRTHLAMWPDAIPDPAVVRRHLP